MPWTTEPGRGFTVAGVEPWLPIGEVVSTVEEQRRDPGSVLAWCRRLIRFRTGLGSRGEQRMLDAPEGVLAWRLGSRTTVAVNLGDLPWPIDVPGTVVFASDATREGGSSVGQLEPWGCVVVESEG
jgi:glycosidase